MELSWRISSYVCMSVKLLGLYDVSSDDRGLEAEV